MIKLTRNTFYNNDKTKRELCDFILRSNQLSMGDKVKEFEVRFSSWQGRKHAVMFNSGSTANLALIQALINMKLIKIGDNIGFSGVTWATNVMPLIQLGLNPIPIDINLVTLNVSPTTLNEVISRIDVLFITNLLGFCDDLSTIKQMCFDNGVLLLEDNCESLGSVYHNIKLGNFGYASTYSFYVGHHLSTIEGGMVCTDNLELADQLRMVRSHGWTRDVSVDKRRQLALSSGVSELAEKYTFYSLASNFRPTELQGFLGCNQLKYLEEMIVKRVDNYIKFHEASKDNKDLIVMPFQVGASNFAFPLIFKNKVTMNEYVKRFSEAGVELRVIVGGDMTKQPFYNGLKRELPNASLVHSQGFYIPNNAELTVEEVELMCQLIRGDKK